MKKTLYCLEAIKGHYRVASMKFDDCKEVEFEVEYPQKVKTDIRKGWKSQKIKDYFGLDIILESSLWSPIRNLKECDDEILCTTEDFKSIHMFGTDEKELYEHWNSYWNNVASYHQGFVDEAESYKL